MQKGDIVSNRCIEDNRCQKCLIYEREHSDVKEFAYYISI